MKKDPKFFLKHILESIEVIENFTEDISEDEFMESVKTRDAVIRRLTIIGEAANNLPAELKKQYSEVSWGDIIGLRNLLTHEYFGVDLGLTFRIVKQDIPQLKEKISKILKDLED